MAFKNRIVRYGEASVADIMFNPMNWRIHPGEQQEVMTEALREFGWVQNVVINDETGNLLDGHMRVQLADENGEVGVPATWVSLTAEEEAAVLAMMDLIPTKTVTDWEKLGELLSMVEVESLPLQEMLSEVAVALTLPDLDGSPLTEGYRVVVKCANESEYRLVLDRFGVSPHKGNSTPVDAVDVLDILKMEEAA